MRIGLLSDTHGHLDEDITKYLSDCDEIWHAGDIGNIEVLEALESLGNVRAVYGNIDGHILRRACTEDLVFTIEGLKVLMTHIGGYPGRYNARIRPLLYAERPDVFICGHSHILKIMQDRSLDCLHINPGSCGHHGFHQMRTLVRFTVQNSVISGMEVVELGKRGEL